MASQRGGLKRPRNDDDVSDLVPPSSFEEHLATLDEEMDLNDILTQGAAEEGLDDDATFYKM
jgi:hypothetical protein